MTASIRKCLFAILFTVLPPSAATVLANPAAVDAKTVVNAPNWVLGSTWYYSDGYALKVTSTEKAVTIFDRLDAPGQWSSRQGFLRKDLRSGTATRTSIFRTVPDQAGMSLRAGSPLTFQREYLENGALVVHASSWSVEGRETITVPAGTFDCWIIVWRSRSLRSDWTGFERWWYSPQAQNYVRMEYKYGAEAEGSRVLMRYQIGPQTAQDAAGSQKISSAADPGKASPNVSPPEASALAAPPLPGTDAAIADPALADPKPESAVAPPAGHMSAAGAPAHSRTADAAESAPEKSGNVWYAQVASSRDEAAIRKRLDKILQRNADILKDVSTNITSAQVGARGIFYRAWLGPFERSAAAAGLCSRLQQGGVSCSVAKSARGGDKRVTPKARFGSSRPPTAATQKRGR